MDEKAKIRIGISSCLLGNKVRFDGGHKHDRYITGTLGTFFDFVPVCPEVECGLSLPRESMRLVSSPESPRLITNKSGTEHTDRMHAWSQTSLEKLAQENLCGFIFKSKSPSSGMERVNVLLHIMGHFKKDLSSDEKKEQLEVIKRFRNNYIPLIVPITLINHSVRKYDEPYLKQQHYLNPHPTELKLRNHA